MFLFLIFLICLLNIGKDLFGIPVNLAYSLMAIIFVVGWILYVLSHYFLAKAKGYSAWLTLLGFINTFGLAILVLLPDRQKTSV